MMARTPTPASFFPIPSRWLMFACVAVAVGAFAGLHLLLTEQGQRALNDVAWCIASLFAGFLCWRCSTLVAHKERLAWRLFALACISWLIGQSIWTYYEVLQGKLPPLPHWMQWFFSGYDGLFVAALLALPRPEQTRQLTWRHVGNLILIVCALSTALVIALAEPVVAQHLKPLASLSILVRAVGLSAMFIVALYLLWSHRWRELHQPLLWLLLGAGLHTMTYIDYVHKWLVLDYVVGTWVNDSWLLVFGIYAAAAYERGWQIESKLSLQHEIVSRQERIIEAATPAVLIAVMIGTCWYYRDWLTPRSATWAMVPALTFAIVLGLREAWIQHQEQRLLRRLNDANTSLQIANRDLEQSEARIRKMNTELEARVAARTAELKDAYHELENFAYAVAHDLKAPLRAIDGFGSVLAHEYAEHLDDAGKHYLHRIRGNALKMAELIDDLLAYARVDRRQFDIKASPVRSAIQHALDEQQDELTKHGVEVITNVAEVTAKADEAGLGIALRNLLQNAIKFSKQVAAPKICIEAQNVGTDVLITVRDNGMGFDMKYRDRIFEMFQRLHLADDIPGTGIGLAIVRKAVERMGGRVWAESTPGTGATFYIRLPQ